MAKQSFNVIPVDIYVWQKHRNIIKCLCKHSKHTKVTHVTLQQYTVMSTYIFNSKQMAQ